jgi:hypothetical protein
MERKNIACVVGTFHQHMCVICRCVFDTLHGMADVSQVGRGFDTLIENSCKYKDKALETYLISRPPVVIVHNRCTKNYVSKRRFDQVSKSEGESNSEVVLPKTLRSSSTSFNWKENCFICCNPCNRKR